MKKAKLNLVIDALLFLCLAAIAGIGLMIKFVLVPGYKRWEIYQQNVDLLFCGLDRHEWGTIHLVIGLILLALLVLHIVLHWKMILEIYRKLIPNRPARYVIAVILICLAAFLLGFSLFMKPQVLERGFGGHGIWSQNTTLAHPIQE